MDTLIEPDVQRNGSVEAERIRRFHATKVAFMLASFLSLCLSVGLWAFGNEMQAIFVGLWVPSIHSLGTLVLTGERVTQS